MASSTTDGDLQGELLQRAVDLVATASAHMSLADEAALALRYVCEGLAMDAAAFYVVGENTGAEVVAAFGRTRRRGFPYPQLDVRDGRVHALLETSTWTEVDEDDAATRLLHAVVCPGVRQTLAVPVRHGSKLVAALILSRRRRSEFTAPDEALVSIAREVLAMMVHNDSLSRATELNAAILETAYAVSRAISRHLDLDETSRVIAANATRLVRGSRCLLLELDAEKNELVAVASSETEDESLLGTRLRIRGWSMAEMLLQRHIQIEVDDLVWSASVSPSERAVLDAQTILFLPLFAENEPIGALVMFVSAGPDGLGAADLELLEEMAEQAASAIHNARLYGDLTRSRAQIETLLAGMAHLRDLERKGLARLVHDDVIQAVVGAAYKLEVARTMVPEDARTGIDEALAILRDAISGARAVVSNLRPPDLGQMGLAPSLTALVDRLKSDWSVTIGKIVEDVPGLDEVRTTAMYKIAREALTNACKHARAERIWVTLQGRLGARGREAWLMIWDDGCGFSVGDARREDHYGLAMMREQAALVGGVVRIGSSPGKGTTIEVVVPLD